MNTETELLLALKSIQESKRPVEVLRAALKISFKSDYLKDVVADYNAQPR